MADSSAHSESGDSDVSFSSSGAFGRHPGAGAGGAKGLFAGMLYPHAQSLPYGCQMPPLYNNNGYGESESENKIPRLDLGASMGAGVGANGGACSPTAAAAAAGRSQMSPTSYLAAANNFAQLQSMSMNAAAAVALQNAATAAFLAQQHQQQPSTTASSAAASSAAGVPPAFCAPQTSAKTSDMMPLLCGAPSVGSAASGSLSPIADGFYRSATSLSPQSLSHMPNRASTESALSTPASFLLSSVSF